MKTVFFLTALLLTASILYSSDQIVNWDKTSVTGDNINFDGKKFLFKDGKTIRESNSVSFVKFNFNEQDRNSSMDQTGDITVDELKKRAAYMKKKYPDAKALVLYDNGIERMNKDGTRYSLSHYCVMIMNEKELNKSLLAFYNIPGKYSNRIIFARSIASDGTVYNLSQSDISYTEPKQDLDFFSGRRDARIMTANIPGVNVGSIIEYEYETTESAPEDPKQYYAAWFFAGEDPVYESSVKIIVPENVDYYFAYRNMDKKFKPVITNSSGYRTYYFDRGENPPITDEILGPPSEALIPYLKGSPFKNQDYLSQWVSGMIKERMQMDDVMKKTVDNVIARSNAKTEEEKVSVLYRFMQEYVRYLSIKTSLSSGFSGHPAKETFYNKYGDCIDKSILFATILNYVGTEAYPVFLTTNDEAQPPYGEIGVMEGNHAINEIHLKNPKKIIYLDSTGETYRYPYFWEADHGIKSWNPVLNTIRTMDPPPVEFNTQVYNITITLDQSGNGSVKQMNNYTGQMDSGLRGYFLSLNDIQKKSLLRNMIGNDYPGSVLKNYQTSSPADYENNFSLGYEFDANAIAKKTGNYLILNVPVKYGFTFTGLTERKYDLVFETTFAEKNSVEYVLPQGYSPIDLPGSVSIKSDFLSYEGKYSYKDGKIIFTDSYKRLKKMIPPGDYKKFRADVLKINYFINVPVILEKK
jgi:hypothetical protein